MQKKSHSQVKHKTHQKINVQTKKIDGGKITLCSKCLKTITKMEKEFLAKQTAKKQVIKTDTKKSYSSTNQAPTKAKKVATKK